MESEYCFLMQKYYFNDKKSFLNGILLFKIALQNFKQFLSSRMLFSMTKTENIQNAGFNDKISIFNGKSDNGILSLKIDIFSLKTAFLNGILSLKMWLCHRTNGFLQIQSVNAND